MGGAESAPGPHEMQRPVKVRPEMGRETMFRIDVLAGLLLLVGAAYVVVPLIPERQGREFSAEVVRLGPTGPSSGLAGWIFVGARKLRLESIENGDTLVTILDHERHAVTFVDPQKRTYFRLPYPADTTGGLTAFYRHSRDEPCGRGYRAVSLGLEDVDGRPAEKWRCESKGRPKYTEGIPEEDLRLVFVIDAWHIWYDTEHSLMVRHLDDVGDGQELRNVRIAPQPDHLFAAPPDYGQAKAPFMDALDSVARR